MALECTHIRFSVDIKDKFNVKNLKKYIAGTIYPDSRYVTGIDRNLTHDDNFFKQTFYKDDDFKKGWAVHLICDDIERLIIKKTFPELLDKPELDKTEIWIIRAAIKILQDINDFNEFNIQNYLKYLEYTETPNNESLDQMKKYNQIFIDMYKDKEEITINDAYIMWEKLLITEGLAIKVKSKAEELKENDEYMKKIRGIYNKMLSYFNNSKFKPT